LRKNQSIQKLSFMEISLFKSLRLYFEKHGDRIFIGSMLTLVMIVAFAFKKPDQRKIQNDKNFTSIELVKK